MIANDKTIPHPDVRVSLNGQQKMIGIYLPGDLNTNGFMVFNYYKINASAFVINISRGEGGDSTTTWFLRLEDRADVRLSMHRNFFYIPHRVSRSNFHEIISERLTLHKFTRALLACQLSILVNNLPARDGHVGNAGHVLSFKDVEVDSVEMCFGTNGALSLWIPNTNVCIGAHSNHTLAWIHSKNTGSIGRCASNELARGQDSCLDAPVPHNRQTVLNSIDSIWDSPKVILAHRFLVGVECAIVRSNRLQVGQSLHEIQLHRWIRTQWWSHDVGRCMTPIFVPTVTTVRAKSSSDWFAIANHAFASAALHSLASLPGHDVYNIHWSIDTAGNHNGAVCCLTLYIRWTRHDMPLWPGNSFCDHQILALSNGWKSKQCNKSTWSQIFNIDSTH